MSSTAKKKSRRQAKRAAFDRAVLAGWNPGNLAEVDEKSLNRRQRESIAKNAPRYTSVNPACNTIDHTRSARIAHSRGALPRAHLASSSRAESRETDMLREFNRVARAKATRAGIGLSEAREATFDQYRALDVVQYHAVRALWYEQKTLRAKLPGLRAHYKDLASASRDALAVARRLQYATTTTTTAPTESTAIARAFRRA